MSVTAQPDPERASLKTPDPGNLRLAWYRLRDRLLVDAGFQRWAAAFPFTRFMARRRQRELFDLVSGFVYTQTLLAVVELGLLQRLVHAPFSVNEMAALTGLPPASVARLAEAAVPLRIFNRREGSCFGLGDLGAALLGNPGVMAMIKHHALLYRDLADPVALLRQPDQPTELASYWAYARNAHAADLPGKTVADYSDLMAVSQAFVAEEILAAYSFSKHRHVLDIGGGQGAFAIRAAKDAPQTRFTVFDLPAVTSRAAAAIAAVGLSHQIDVHGGDLFSGNLPQGADLACLIRVLYDHDDAHALQILKAAHAALPKGATLLIAEPMAGTKGAERMGAAYFGLYLFAMKGGDARSFSQLSQLAEAAGFSAIRHIKTHSPLLTSVLTAKA
jgi:demethylspheroidene O-methyltransferase